jgi:eukaryotic-like serine/threonine-protein kinase
LSTSKKDASGRRRIDEICLAALEHDSAERAEFVRAACGEDAALLREVEGLLAHAHTAEEFLGASIGAVAADVMSVGSGGSLVGRSFGSYQIVAAIGAGGMGEVYRARDAKLGRDVAIKVLPAEFTDDRDRLARFEREARVLASLNHPNIASIYGLEQIGDVQALVLELVEGETLDARLKPRAPTPADGTRGFSRALAIGDALGIARQIAEALEAAHEKGIVHRDLKPANVKVTPGGTVKVLDFGLAKSGAGSAPELSHSPTITISGTRDGVLLGTAAYMSPEQARGQSVDKRADIWAFGCVLFEMLTEHMPFPGATVSDHIAAILEREPDWSAVPASTPPAIQRLLRRCLEKDPKRRLHDIADARIEIDEALGGKTTPVTPDTKRRRVSPALLASLIAAGLVAALTGWIAWRFAAPRGGSDRALTHLVIQPPTAVTFAGFDFDISPDGSQIVYAGARQGATRLYIRRLDQFDDLPLPGTDGAHSPSFSPDGEWLCFQVQSRLEKINVKAPAAPVAVHDDGQAGMIGTTWAADNTIFFGKPGRAIRRVSAEGGEASAVTTLPSNGQFEDHHNPVVLPGGRAMLFSVHEGVERFSIAVQSLVSGQRKVLIESGFDAQYSPSGHLVFARGSAVLAVPFDVQRLDVTGPPVTLLEHVATFPNSGYGAFRLSTSGTMVFVPERSEAGRVLTWVDRSGVETPLPISPRAFTSLRVSPDGKRLAFAAADGDREDIWVYEFATDHLVRATLEGINRHPIWTPDGLRLTYESIREKAMRSLVWQPADGSAPPELLVSSRNRLIPGSWALGNRALVYVDSPPTDRSRILVLSIDGERRSAAVVPKSDETFTRVPRLSPDGAWLAYASNETGRFQVYLQTFPTSGSRRQLTVDGGYEPVWMPNGRELVYRGPGMMFAVRIDTTHGFSAAKPEPLFGGRYASGSPAGFAYDVAPDGRFVMIKPGQDELPPPRLHVVLNWVDELARRVPAGR